VKHAWMLCVLVIGGCESLTGGADEDEGPKLIVTERSATTLKLQWDAISDAVGGEYTVDYFTGYASCNTLMQHGDVLHVTGTSVLLTGLTPSTRYHIHVHSLPARNNATNVAFVNTLSAGAVATPTLPADYERC
jgi:hypothetical protein